MKKLIDIPEKIHNILLEHKERTGRNVTGMILEALYRWLIHENLMIVKRRVVYVDEENKSNGKIIAAQEVPESIKFCDGDSCEMPVLPLKQGC